MVRPAGLEPATPGLEGRCSIRMSYRRTGYAKRHTLKWSGQRDSNPRPSAPKADALPDCAIPRRGVDNNHFVYLGQGIFYGIVRLPLKKEI